MLAASHACPECVRALLEAGADALALSSTHSTALMEAAWRNPAGSGSARCALLLAPHSNLDARDAEGLDVFDHCDRNANTAAKAALLEWSAMRRAQAEAEQVEEGLPMGRGSGRQPRV